MYDNVTLELKNILEPRLSPFYFERNNFFFKSITFQEIENIDLNAFRNQKTIIFLLDSNHENLKSSDKLRLLLSYSLVFTNKNLLKLFGVPERYFYFNPLLDEKLFFLSNNSDRNILNEMYDFNKNYFPFDLNNIFKITIALENLTEFQEEKIFIDIIKFLSCGCNVFIQSHEIINLFPENIKKFLNLEMSENDKLEAQFQIHKNYSYVIQVNSIEEQLYGIFGHINDLVE